MADLLESIGKYRKYDQLIKKLRYKFHLHILNLMYHITLILKISYIQHIYKGHKTMPSFKTLTVCNLFVHT